MNCENCEKKLPNPNKNSHHKCSCGERYYVVYTKKRKSIRWWKNAKEIEDFFKMGDDCE